MFRAACRPGANRGIGGVGGGAAGALVRDSKTWKEDSRFTEQNKNIVDGCRRAWREDRPRNKNISDTPVHLRSTPRSNLHWRHELDEIRRAPRKHGAEVASSLSRHPGTGKCTRRRGSRASGRMVLHQETPKGVTTVTLRAIRDQRAGVAPPISTARPRSSSPQAFGTESGRDDGRAAVLNPVRPLCCAPC